MVSTVEKMRIGIPPGGMSPEADMDSGGASYFFTRIHKLPAQGPPKARHVPRHHHIEPATGRVCHHGVQRRAGPLGPAGCLGVGLDHLPARPRRHLPEAD